MQEVKKDDLGALSRASAGSELQDGYGGSRLLLLPTGLSADNNTLVFLYVNFPYAYLGLYASGGIHLTPAPGAALRLGHDTQRITFPNTKPISEWTCDPKSQGEPMRLLLILLGERYTVFLVRPKSRRRWAYICQQPLLPPWEA